MKSVTFAFTHSIVPQSTHDVLLKLIKSDKSQVYFSLVYYYCKNLDFFITEMKIAASEFKR